MSEGGPSMDKESEMTRKFFKRLSSFKVDYEKENRRTLKRYQSSYRDSGATFLRDKDTIMSLLRDTLQGDDLEQMYVELFCVLFPTVKERERPDSKPLLAFLQKIFALTSQAHDALMHRAKSHHMEHRVLFLEVVEARNLPGMDLNGLSDPFCTLFVTSKESSKRTKVVEKSLNPQWNETFKFKLKEPNTEFFRIEVWDHDPEERLRDKLRKYKDITSARGIGSFVRDLGHGRHSAQEFIGRVSIPLKDVTTETVERWWPLGSDEQSGEIYLRLGLGVDKDRTDAVNWYRGVLQLLMIYELGKSPLMVPFQWEHVSEAWGEYLLRQMQTGWGLTAKDILLAKWVAYTRLHPIFPLSGRILPPLLFQVFEAAINSDFNANDVSLILQASNDLLKFAVAFVEKIHEFFPCIVTTSQLYYVLKTLEILGKSVDRLCITCDNRTAGRTEITSLLISTEIRTSIQTSARTTVSSIVKAALPAQDSPLAEENEADEVPIEREAKQLLRVGQLLIDDLEKGLGAVDKDFKMIVKLDFHRLTYEIFDLKLEEMMKPFISKFCNHLMVLCTKPPGSPKPEGSDPAAACQQSDAASTFLHLYLCLRKFSDLSPTDHGLPLLIKPYFHLWFYPGVGHLFDLMSLVWMGWMRRAVKADFDWVGPSHENLMSYPNEADAKVTSSAMDSVQIFTQIQTFWTTLNWPDQRQAAIFAKKLLRELCGFSILFANLTMDSLEKENDKTSETTSPYNITPRLCRSINNIIFVGDYTKEIAVHLNLQQLLVDIQSDFAGDGCLMERQVEIQESGLNGIVDSIIISTVSKMDGWASSQISGMLRAHDEKQSISFDAKVMELLNFLTVNLRRLDEHLLSSHFVPFLAIIWESFVQILKRAIAAGIRDGKSWEHFVGQKTILDIVKGYLETAILRHCGRASGLGGIASSSALNLSPNFHHVLKQLDVYAVPVAGIKLRYLARRHTDEGAEKRGLICIHASYQRDHDILLLTILNASKLPSADSNGKSDPFVQVGFVPEENFPGLSVLSTKVVKEDLYPIFEEKFNIKVSQEMMRSGGYLRLVIYDHDFLRKNEFLGEAFLPLSTVHQTTTNATTVAVSASQERTILQLTAPSNKDIEYLKSLVQNRVDKELKRFLESEREKMVPPTLN
ncbi:protein unc-13 homolog 4B [Folsomia candida]|uniref:protein unc-13 homolog 4B n=1 Tax=Folsomia candida TaxID=158441 RepID=UPI000B8FCEB2|nr:protein unc-13 homolog 4B [Folsomia candida]